MSKAGLRAPFSRKIAEARREWVPGISERAGGATKFGRLDRLGTASRKTDASGAVAATRTYDAFGQPLTLTDPASGQGFASAFGYQEDPESGLKLLGHRYYDPGTGRFVTRDPVGSGTNWYAYCENNPLKSVDPEGLQRLIIRGQAKNGENDSMDRVLAGYYTEDGDYSLYAPTEMEILLFLLEHPEVDTIVVVGHGSVNGVTMRRNKNGKGTQYFSPELLKRALGKRRLKLLVLESCNQLTSSPKGTGLDMRWGRTADAIVGYDECTDTFGSFFGFDPPWGGSGHPKVWFPRKGRLPFRPMIPKK